MALDDKPLTVRQAAQHLQVSEITVQRWLRAGKLRGTRPGGTRMGWRIPTSEVLRVLREGSPTPR